ncbi:hypothetical protein HG536_0D04990 [Torulaspora globosa]|uniref:CNH domain-containing protein n=1 Tax=Torulaspora globosa TaxID=48254 RepID=A0A7G3ZHJ1_9SACH|nr:uncharacterized protein HG536_0D04990 [Torulaspora globosa]QLL32977.1 hypothetical protein HG536_0D04990 [Torulaspora globosa]
MAEQGEECLPSDGSSPQIDQPQLLPGIEQHGDGFFIEDGPFQTVELIDDLPSEMEYVQCEAFDQNIYLGTSTGDLLHYFEIEPRNYILVSQTKFDSDLSVPIDKILLLPNIERALVLSNQTLVLFLLPEFAPAPNTLSLNGITDIALRGYSSTSKSYKFYAAQAEAIKLLKVSSSAITLFRNFDFGSVSRMVAQGHHLAVAKQNNYEVLDLKTFKVIPLFRVSEVNAPLRPVVAEFKKQEFLVATGGGSYNDSSMALVVNHSGDIVNASIVLDNYPSSIIVEYPYLIVRFKPNRVSIYRLEDESKIVQKITTESLKVRVAKTSKSFSGFERPEIKESVVDMMRRVPLVGNANQLKIENEKALVGDLFEERCSTVLYGSFGIHLLIRPPPVLVFGEHNEPGMSAIEEYLVQSDQPWQSKFRLLENQYLHSLLLLLQVLHSPKIDLILLRKWCSMANTVDARLLLYGLGFQIYGTLWIFNGLKDLIERLKSLKLYHKCDDLEWLLRSIKNLFEKNNAERSNGDYQNVVKTLDVNMFKLKLDKKQNDIDITVFHEDSLAEIMNIIEADQNVRLDLRLQVMQRRGMFKETIELLKKEGETKKLLKFLQESGDKLPSSYGLQIIDDVLFIIEREQQLNRKLISQTIELLSTLKIDPRELLERVEKNASVKVLIIQELGPEDANDRQFLFDYYMAKMQEFLQDIDVQKVLKDYAETYSQDISYAKCTVKEFFIIKLKNNKRFRPFLENYETLEALCLEESDLSLMKSILSKIETFDIGNILTILFLPEGKAARNFMTNDRLLEIFITFNDFMSIEELLMGANVIRVLEHYASFRKRQHSLALVTKLLERNANLIQDEVILISVLANLPSDYNFDALFGFLYPVLRKISSQSKELELLKVLLKNRISAYNHFMEKIDIRETEG